MSHDSLAQPRRGQVTVIGNSQATAEVLALSERAGAALGRVAGIIITGGRGGVMEAVCRGAKSVGALTVGVLPGSELEGGNAYLDVVLPTGIGFARNSMNVLAADVVVAIGGAAGTLSEIAFAWMYGKPVVALRGADGWAERLSGERLDDRRLDTIEQADTVEQLASIVGRLLGDRRRG